MSLFARVMPEFWTRTAKPGGPRMLFNYRRMWKQTVIVTALVCLLPLWIMAAINYYQYHHALRAELIDPTERLVQNSSRSVNFFLAERVSALNYIVEDNSFEQLAEGGRLGPILAHLKRAFGGFIDLGVIDSNGVQLEYTGPYQLEGKNYRKQEWFKEVVIQGQYISDVFLGYRDYPHFVIAVTHEKKSGELFVLRATIDTDVFNELTKGLAKTESSDAFIVSTDGLLQTPSQFYGQPMDAFWHPLPRQPDPGPTLIQDLEDPQGRDVFLAYQHIENSPFVMVLVKSTPGILKGWFSLRKKLIGFFAVSTVGVLIAILGVCTHLVSRIYVADRRREMLLHKVEYTNKLASLGRLAAGVAHEINNPLAVINEKAGLLKDLLAISKDFPNREKANSIADSILYSVSRCSTITHRLLGFARHLDVAYETIDLDHVVKEVLSFMGKEFEYRNVKVNLTVDENLPAIQTDRGQIQQVVLNLLNNAFAAVSEGGRIDIHLYPVDGDKVALSISDNGCGIPPEHQKLVFEPFFSTKGRSGTGLGLSITYGIVQKLGGNIDLKSTEGVGTTFTVTLPVKGRPETAKEKEGEA
ncbi:MAG: two-component sensor histidine kinase [Deltaproteobacteria bacterium]|nr:two-component sensor histidine kinase [Deltaproteobacteria bacterium]